MTNGPMFRDLDEFFDGSLSLPVGGKSYRIPEPDARTGLWVQRVFGAGLDAVAGRTPAGPPPVLDDDQEANLYERVLGPVYAELVDDGVSWPRIAHIGRTAALWTAYGAEIAARYWESGDQQGEPAAPPTPRRQRSTRTAGAATTRKAASTSGTKRPKPS